MELTLDQALQKGIEAHKAGRVQEADRYYTAILKANPKHPDANHNMGVLAVGIGKVEQALPFFETALEASPSTAQYWLSYINALISLDRLDDAKAVFEQAKSKSVKGDAFEKLKERLENTSVTSLYGQDPPSDQQQALINLYTQGQYQEALSHAQQLLKQFPNSINLYNIIGAANKGLGKLEEAIEIYNKALAIKPDYADAYNNIGVVLQEQGKLGMAIQAYNKAVGIKPDDAEAYYNMGNALRDQGELEAAIKAYTKAVSIKPDYAESSYNAGNIFQDQGKLDEAVEAYKKALSIKPDNADAYNNMGAALRDQGELDEAIEAYNKALSIKPDYAEAYYNAGNVFQEQDKLDEAIEAYSTAIAIKPDFAEGHRNLTLIKNYNGDDKHFIQLQEYYDTDGLSEETKCQLSFALAKIYEDIGDLDKSFYYLSEGNTLRKKLLKYSIEQDEKFFSQLKKIQPTPLKSRLPITENSVDAIPIFILGMPRSGTTLVEQIISSHSEVLGAGELKYINQFGRNLIMDPTAINTSAISKLRERYLTEISKLPNCNQFITDKMPQNFLYIPLICAAFPEAKIIHVKRDPTATCWSNYKHYFDLNGLGYCYDLKDVVTYYLLYKDLMQFWQVEYSDRIYHLNYESLTTDQENQTKKLIKHLGLNWEEACLSPHKNKRSVRTASQQQVRQKVYKGSSEAWRKYEPYLNGAFDSLQSA